MTAEKAADERLLGLGVGMFGLLEVVLVFVWSVYLLETYLSWRQHRKLHEKNLPKAMVGVISEEKFEQARLYGLDKSRFEFISSFFNQVESTAVLWFFGLPWLWSYSTELVGKMGYAEDAEITISLVFVGLLSAYEMVLHMPWTLYSTFVIEERHGFNKQTLALFFTDLVKEIGMGIVIGAPVLSGLIYLIKWSGPYFYIYVWLFLAIFMMFMLTIYPTVIAPLFNKFTALEEGELRTEIEKLASKINFPLTKLFVVDGSRRSGHSNAYFYGFFKNKRIVLYDTLINQMDTPEIVSVLGHELGHWSLNHTMKLMVIAQIQIFTSFFMFGQILNWDLMYTSFGFTSKPTIIGMFLFFQFLMSPVDHILGFLMNMLSRTFEFQADAFAKKLGYAKELRSGLIKISQENLGNFNPDKWYSTYHYSHPPLQERLEAIASKQD